MEVVVVGTNEGGEKKETKGNAGKHWGKRRGQSGICGKLAK
jgi:hypothetical protein